MKKINLLLIILIIAGTGILANWPLLINLKKEGWVFLGRYGAGYTDTYPEISLIEQARTGKWKLENLYSDGKSGGMVMPSYLAVGKTASGLGITAIEAYQVFRVLGYLVFCGVLLKLLGRFWEDTSSKIVGLAVVLTSGGLGYAVGRWLPGTIDTVFPEAMTFLTLKGGGQTIFSQALMMLAGYWYLKNKKIGLLMTLGWLALEKPFSAMTMVAVILICEIWNQSKRTVVNGMWFTGSRLTTFEPTKYIFGYGLILFAALAGMEKYLREESRKGIFLLSWVAVGFVEVYLPFSWGIKMGNGLHIPMAILAAEGIRMAAGKLKGAKRVIFAGLAVGILAIGSVVSVDRDVKQIKKDTDLDYTFYIMDAEMAGMEWLAGNTKEGEVVLSNWFFGNIIPGVTGRRVYAGHEYLTDKYSEKLDNLNGFISGGDGEREKTFLRENGIRYIYAGEGDEIMGGKFKPDEREFLEKVYDKGNTRIYKVK